MGVRYVEPDAGFSAESIYSEPRSFLAFSEFHCEQSTAPWSRFFPQRTHS